jgi:general secretion pathway protein M
MRALSPRESRLAAIGLLVAVLAMVDFAVIQPLFNGFSDRAQQRQELLARYAANDRTIAAIPRLSREASRRKGQTTLYVLTAADTATAGDLLRDRMQAIANNAGAEFHGGEDVAAPPGMVATRFAMRVPAGKLAPLLAAIENAPPLVIINGLSVSADDALVTGNASSLEVKIEDAIANRPAAAR